MKSLYPNYLLWMLLPALATFGAIADPSEALTIRRLGSAGTTANPFGAEIPAYDLATRRLFVTSPNNQLNVLDINDPANPSILAPINLGADVTSVAVKNGIVAVALTNPTITNNGTVAFYSAAYDPLAPSIAPLATVTVGALPDMLTFTPDGTRVLVANEGEPSGGVDPDGSISIIDLNLLNGILNPTVRNATFTDFNGRENTLRGLGVRIFPNKTVSQDVEPEYIAVSDDSTRAWVSLQENNALAVVDILNATVTEILPLGAKNFNAPGNAFDPSDRDGVVFGGSATSPAVRILNWPVRGLYQPDTLATVTIAGQTYLLSANEGDTRTEAARVSTLTLDSSVFPNAANLQLPQNLGRLDVSTIDGNSPNGYRELFAYGGRSFSIWNITNGLNQAYDSGNDFETILSIFSATPLTFSIYNSDGAPGSFDSRSDNRGPEPEGLAVGRVGNRLYSFIGLERAGGFVAYDITDPLNPGFTDYVNDWQLGDRSPEGLLFIPASESPTRIPLLVVANEVSRNVAIYSLETVPEPSAILGLLSLGLAGYGLRKRRDS